MKVKSILLAVIVILGTGCCRYGDYNDIEGRNQWTDATVVFMGAPEVDGCGWLILIDEEYYYPVNLDDEYRIDSLAIQIKYYYDPIEYRCGRGGTRYPSIRITASKTITPSVGILDEEDWDTVPMDRFVMDSAYVSGDNLYLQVSYSGGCSQHEFNLWKLPPGIVLDPPPVELMLSHEDNDDMCEAWLTRWLVFSLKPIRERGKREITFLLRGSPEMSAYFGEFTYKY
ncbi:MAG: hypothetical protein V2A67_10910 [Bacteroidota bacterium]